MCYLPLERRLIRLAALVSVLAAFPAHALIITGGSSPAAPAFQAALTYTFDSVSGSADLVVELQNTTAPAVGGFLTAFVLNNPGGSIAAVNLEQAPVNWNLLGLDDDNVNGAPFGQFDFGATTFANANSNSGFQGGGDPSVGIAAGAGGRFIFRLEGSALGTLDEASFLSAFSVPPGAGGDTQFFTARFRGIPGTEDSAKVPAVPEPSTYLALLAGVALLAWRRHRRQST